MGATSTSFSSHTTCDTAAPVEKVAQATVYEQLREFRARIPKDVLEKYEKPRAKLSIIQTLTDWTVAIVAWQLYIRSTNPGAFFISTLLMAYSQRGISNLLHDCSHYNLFGQKALNVVFGNLFLAPALMSSVRAFRKTHTSHHHYLGTENDPDHGLGNESSLRHYRLKRFDHKTMLGLFLFDLPDPVVWTLHTLGALPSESGFLLTWWTVAGLLTGLFEPQEFVAPFGWRFLFLWHFSRCTIMYAVYILREIIDHSGLPPTSVLAFTRSSPCCNIIQGFLQPHSDNYHLLHHLLPRVPMGNLHEFHVWLNDNVVEYKEANQYSNYFSGDNPLFTQTLHTNSTRHIIDTKM